MGNPFFKHTKSKTARMKGKKRDVIYRPYEGISYDTGKRSGKYEVIQTPAGDGNMNVYTGTTRRGPRRTVKKTKERTENMSSKLATKLSRSFNKRYKTKTVYKDGQLKKKRAGGKTKRY